MFSRRFFIGGTTALTLRPALANEGISSNTEITTIGENIITGFRGTKPDDREVEYVCEKLASNKIAGVLLLERNITSPNQLTNLTAKLREASPTKPPVIAIDQEGGRVARVGAKNGFLDWLSAERISSTNWSNDEIFDYYFLRAQQLQIAGINLNFSPVVDLNLNPSNPIIGGIERSYGSDPKYVTRLAEIVIAAHRKAEVATCLKHFPGHGSSEADTHLGMVNVSNTWQPEELEPYSKMIAENNVDAIMSSHIINNKLGLIPNIPFSLSQSLKNILRDNLGYKGPIFSDDMQMGAIIKNFGFSEAVRLSINAGNTFLVYSNFNPAYEITNIEDIISAIEIELMLGAIDEAQLRNQLKLASQFRMSLT